MNSTTYSWISIGILFILVISSEFSGQDDNKGTIARTYKETFEKNVPDKAMRDKITDFLKKLPKSERAFSIVSQFEHNLTGKPKKKSRIIGLIVVGLIASVVDATLRVKTKQDERQYQEALSRHNRALKREEENLNKLRTELDKLDNSIISEERQLEKQNICREHCRNWLSIYSCQINRGRCPDIPEDNDTCATPPFCFPVSRCKSNPVGVIYKNEGHQSRSSLKRMKRKRKRKLLRSGWNKEKSGKFAGTELFYRHISDALGSYQASLDAEKLFNEIAHDRGINSSLIKEMYEIMQYLEPKHKARMGHSGSRVEDPTSESGRQDLAEAIPAILSHLIPINRTLEQDKLKLEKNVYGLLEDFNCPDCRLFHPHVMAINCSYTCPNRAACPHYACNCD